jgi:hypothetical protein
MQDCRTRHVRWAGADVEELEFGLRGGRSEVVDEAVRVKDHVPACPRRETKITQSQSFNNKGKMRSYGHGCTARRGLPAD